jgi:hypothetical protein
MPDIGSLHPSTCAQASLNSSGVSIMLMDAMLFGYKIEVEIGSVDGGRSPHIRCQTLRLTP